MKVMHVLNTGKYSGAENVVISLIQYLQKKEIKSVYVSYDGPIRDILKEFKIDFFPIKALNRGELRNAIRKINPDIIHAHDFTASIKCALFGIGLPVISHIHCAPPWMGTIGLKSICYGITCLRYKRILSVSLEVFKKYKFYPLIKKKVINIKNPIDTQKITSMSEKAECKEKYDIVFLGRLSDEKNPMLFLDVLSSLKDNDINFSAVMIGDGILREQVNRMIYTKKLQKNVTLKGFMNNPYGILGNSKVLCVTSKWEGFGLVAVEAISLGIPVVSTSVGAISQIITDKVGRICTTPNDFVSEITNLLTKSEYYEKKKKAAVRLAYRLDNIDNYITKLETIYRKICPQ